MASAKQTADPYASSSKTFSVRYPTDPTKTANASRQGTMTLNRLLTTVDFDMSTTDTGTATAVTAGDIMNILALRRGTYTNVYSPSNGSDTNDAVVRKAQYSAGYVAVTTPFEGNV